MNHRPWEASPVSTATVETFRKKAVEGLTGMAVSYCLWKYHDDRLCGIGDVARIVQELSETHFDIEIPLHGSSMPDRVEFKKQVENDVISQTCKMLKIL